MKIPEKVNGAKVKNNLRGFIRDLEKYKKLKEWRKRIRKEQEQVKVNIQEEVLLKRKMILLLMKLPSKKSIFLN